MLPKIALTIIVITIIVILFKKSDSIRKFKKSNSDNNAVEMKKDPICGLYVEDTTSHKVKLDEEIYSFCSKECRDKFIASKKK